MALRRITVNGKVHRLEAEDEMPLLWVLRDLLGLTGTKFGCGEGICGACTVLENGIAVRSCQTSVASAAGKSYTTIEGLAAGALHPIQQAWLAEDVAQCGYCQPGMILELHALLRKEPTAGAAAIDDALSDHVCRCGSYPRIRKAALLAARSGAKR